MKGLALIHNKDERAMVRSALAGFSTLAMHGNLKDGLDDIRRNKGAFEFAVLDERFDQSQDSRNEQLKILDLLESLHDAEGRESHAVVMVILNESTTLEAPVSYAEIGVDLFLRRPFGTQELRAKLAEAMAWIESPPPLVRLMKTFQEALRIGRYGEVIGGLEALYEKNPLSIRVGVLFARALMQSGSEGRKRAIEIALTFDDRYPDSLFAKMLLIEGYRGEGRINEAFETALRLYSCNPTPDTFNQVIGMAGELTADKAANFGPWLAILEVLKEQEAPRTRERRVRVFSQISQQKPGVDVIALLLQYLERGQEDIQPQIKESIESWTRALQQQIQGMGEAVDPRLEPVYLTGLKMLLDIDPGLPWALESFTDIQIRQKNYKAAEKCLFKARDKNKTSVQFYSSFVKLALEEGRLKEASDYLHAGRRLAPSDDRWDALAAIWSELYTKSQKAA